MEPHHSTHFPTFPHLPSPYYEYYNKFNIDLEVLSLFYGRKEPQNLNPKIRRDAQLNIICDKTLLSTAIDGVSKAVTLRSTIPVLEGILLKAEASSSP